MCAQKAGGGGRPLDRGIGAVAYALTHRMSPLLRATGHELPPRPLSREEASIARQALGDAIDADRVRIVRALSLDTWVPREGHVARVIGDTIFMPGLDGPLPLLTLVHELCHVAQYQRGGVAYIGNSILAQVGAQLKGLGRNGAYDWKSCLEAGVPWEAMGAECQAQLVADNYLSAPSDARVLAALAAARAGRGWCGSEEPTTRSAP